MVLHSIARLCGGFDAYAAEVRGVFAGERDPRVADEYIEDGLDRDLRESEEIP